MREIKFRGKRIDNGEWVEGDFCHPCNIVFKTIGYDEILKQDNVTIFNDHEVIPETVGQYTGLKDKNGKEIYEGDIVKCVAEDFEETVGQGVYEVVFQTRNGTAYFGVKKDEKNTYGFNCDFTPANKCEVIGNIYDNPELLKE